MLLCGSTRLPLTTTQQKKVGRWRKETDKRGVLAPLLLIDKGKRRKMISQYMSLIEEFLTRLLWFYVFSVPKISVLWQLSQVSPRTAAHDQQNVMSSCCPLTPDGGL